MAASVGLVDPVPRTVKEPDLGPLVRKKRADPHSRRASPLIAAAALVSPASLYLAATPRFRFVGLLPILAYLLAASATRRGRLRVGGLLVAATAGFFGWPLRTSPMRPLLRDVLGPNLGGDKIPPAWSRSVC